MIKYVTSNDEKSNVDHEAMAEDDPIRIPDSFALLKPAWYGAAVAEQYAAMLVCFWRELKREGRLKFDQFLDVLDFCPAVDPGGALLTKAIHRQIFPNEFPQIRYIPWIRKNSSAQLREYDWEYALCGDIASDNGALIYCSAAQSFLAYSAENPVAVIAHDAWSQIGQDLFAIHYGKLLRANFSLLRSQCLGEDEKFWELADDFSWDIPLHEQLAHYRNELNSSPLIYPRGAISALKALSKVALEGGLVISYASGCINELGVRLASFSQVMLALRSDKLLPVNFELIAAWVRATRGIVREVELSSDRVLQVFLFGRSSEAGLIDKVMHCIDQPLLESSFHLIEVSRLLGERASLDVRLGLLKLSKYDPAVFSAGASDLIRMMANTTRFNRRHWAEALERVWGKYLVCPIDCDACYWLSQASMHCGHWGLARTILEHRIRKRGESALDLANLAWCESRTGQLGKGLQFVTKALSLEPGHNIAHEVNRRLSERHAKRDALWRVEIRHPDIPILLEPLDLSHAQALCYQYRDDQIAVMTGLPHMSDLEKVKQWIVESDQEHGKINYAVMHNDWGFVGFINLAVSKHSAFFCFWTGVDFQGKGLATAAGRIVCAHAKRCGVPLILTSAYKDNHRSVRALMRLGFAELSVRARPPDHDRVFFALYDSTTHCFDCDQELVDYYRRENLSMDFDWPMIVPLSSAVDLGNVRSVS